MAKIEHEPHETYETHYRYDVVDFISTADNGPLRAQEITDDSGGNLSTPPAGAAIWREWHSEVYPDQERLIEEVEYLIMRPLGQRAFRLASLEDATI